MAALESDDDSLIQNDNENVEVDDIFISDEDIKEVTNKEIYIDLNSRLTSKSHRKLKNKSDSCDAQFQLSNADFKTKDDDVVSSSEEINMSDDDAELVSSALNINAHDDLQSFIDVKTQDYGCQESHVCTKNQTSLQSEKFDSENFKENYFTTAFKGLKIAHPKFNSTVGEEFLHNVADEDDKKHFNLSRSLSGQLKFLEFHSDEETDLDAFSIGVGSGLKNDSNHLRYRHNASSSSGKKKHLLAAIDDSDATDEEVLSDEKTQLLPKKRRKSNKNLIKLHSQSDAELTEVEDFYDSSDVIYKTSPSKLKEWTETDESGGMTQVTQIKTETSIKVVGGDDDGCENGSTTTTTTTRIVTTVTTNDGDQEEQETEDSNELRRSMEEVLNQFMTDESSSKETDSPKH